VRPLKFLPVIVAAAFLSASAAGAATAPSDPQPIDAAAVVETTPAPTTTVVELAAPPTVGDVTDAVTSSTDAASVDPAGQPTRGEPIQVGPTLPPAPVLPPGAMGDQSIPDSLDLPANSGEGRRIVYSNSLMRIWAVDENGEVVKTHRVSGKPGVPYVGTYSVYSRSISTFSAHNPTITWHYMVRFAHTPNGGQVGFHEIPTQCVGGSCHRMQTEDQLGQGLSGGCVRQSTEDAIWVWNWADVGTKVVVLP